MDFAYTLHDKDILLFFQLIEYIMCICGKVLYMVLYCKKEQKLCSKNANINTFLKHSA